MQTRRNFVKGLAGAGITVPFLRENAFGQLFKANVIAGDRAPEAIADDEVSGARSRRRSTSTGR